MPLDWSPLWLSLRVAVLSTALSLVVGLALAYLFANYHFRGKELWDSIITLPLALPPTVLGYYLLILLGRSSAIGRTWEAITGSPLVFTPTAAVIAAFFHSAPLLVKSARAALESVDHSYERAARTLGSSDWRVFARVSLPLAAPSIAAATLLAFARSLGDFGVTIMLAGNIPGRTQTAAVAIYEAVESGDASVARAFVLAISAIILIVLALANKAGGSLLPTRPFVR